MKNCVMALMVAVLHVATAFGVEQPAKQISEAELKKGVVKLKKVLYVTHEPGRWHKYTPQMAAFKEIAKETNWDVTYSTGSHDDQLKKLRKSDYAKGYDAVVYNFCFATSKDFEAEYNLMQQTTENGVPALLIHCAMHSWWASYRDGNTEAFGPDYKGKGKSKADLVATWKKAHPDKPFPIWGDFTGVASTRHGPKQPVTCTKAEGHTDHPATKRMPEGFTTGRTELYNNVYVTKGVVPLVVGQQGEAKAIVMWTVPRGKSAVMGLTIGHDVSDWNLVPFRHLIIDGTNFLMK